MADTCDGKAGADLVPSCPQVVRERAQAPPRTLGLLPAGSFRDRSASCREPFHPPAARPRIPCREGRRSLGSGIDARGLATVVLPVLGPGSPLRTGNLSDNGNLPPHGDPVNRWRAGRTAAAHASGQNVVRAGRGPPNCVARCTDPMTTVPRPPGLSEGPPEGPIVTHLGEHRTLEMP